MAYCRFSNADIYLFPSIEGGITCCACRLAALVPTIFTEGGDFLGAKIEPCKCAGKGCQDCMMHSDTHSVTHAEAIEHVLAHQRAGHDVPEFVLAELRAEMAAREEELQCENAETEAEDLADR